MELNAFRPALVACNCRARKRSVITYNQIELWIQRYNIHGTIHTKAPFHITIVLHGVVTVDHATLYTVVINYAGSTFKHRTHLRQGFKVAIGDLGT